MLIQKKRSSAPGGSRCAATAVLCDGCRPSIQRAAAIRYENASPVAQAASQVAVLAQARNRQHSTRYSGSTERHQQCNVLLRQLHSPPCHQLSYGCCDCSDATLPRVTLERKRCSERGNNIRRTVQRDLLLNPYRKTNTVEAKPNAMVCLYLVRGPASGASSSTGAISSWADQKPCQAHASGSTKIQAASQRGTVSAHYHSIVMYQERCWLVILQACAAS